MVQGEINRALTEGRAVITLSTGPSVPLEVRNHGPQLYVEAAVSSHQMCVTSVCCHLVAR